MICLMPSIDFSFTIFFQSNKSKKVKKVLSQIKIIITFMAAITKSKSYVEIS